MGRPPTARLTSLLLLQAMLMAPSASCRPRSTSRSSPRRAAAFIPHREARRGRRVFGKDGARRMAGVSLRALNDVHSTILISTADDAVAPPMEFSELQDNLQIEQLSSTTTIAVFIIGVIPFIWATYEFWRRIAVGASFGTGSDSVVIPSPFDEGDDDLIAIGEDGDPRSSRGRRTLDRGALTVAYVLFAAAGGSVAIAIASVLMGPSPSM